MSEPPPRRCQCGNWAKAGRPTCGIVICLANNTYEIGAAILDAEKRPSASEVKNG